MAELFVSNDKDILNQNTVTFEERKKQIQEEKKLEQEQLKKEKI